MIAAIILGKTAVSINLKRATGSIGKMYRVCSHRWDGGRLVRPGIGC